MFIKYELFVSQDLYSKYEEVFSNWPELEAEVDMKTDENKCTLGERNEERKEKEEAAPVMRKMEVRITDEDIAMSNCESYS